MTSNSDQGFRIGYDDGPSSWDWVVRGDKYQRSAIRRAYKSLRRFGLTEAQARYAMRTTILAFSEIRIDRAESLKKLEEA
jgi:hypothetical protein